MGGDEHGEPRGDTLEGGKPEKDVCNFKKCNIIKDLFYPHTLLSILNYYSVCKVGLYIHTWSSQWFAVKMVGGDRGSAGGRHGAAI